MKKSIISRGILVWSILWFSLSANAQTHKYVELVNSQQVLKEASDLYSEEKYAEAIKLFLTVPRGDTNYYQVQYQMSYCQYKLEKYEEAVATSRRLLAEGSKEMSQYNILGSCLIQLKKYDEALAMYNQLLAENPYSANFMLSKGLAYEAAEDYKNAFETYKQLLAMNPLFPGAHLRLAYLAEREGRYTQAIMSFAFYLVLDPDSRKSLAVVDDFNKLCAGNSNNVNKAKTQVLTNEFEDLDLFIVNQSALKKEFKVPTKMDYAVNRQLYLVMSQLKGNTSYDNGFYSKTYLPFYNSFLAENSFEHFALLMLASSDQESIAKEVKKNIQPIIKCRENCLTKFRSMFPGKKIMYGGKEYDLDFYYDDNFYIDAMGKKSGEKNVGPWLVFNQRGNVVLFCEFGPAGTKEGTMYMFDENGDTTKILRYKNDLLNGDYATYSEGAVKFRGTYENDELNGTITEYYPNGTIRSTDSYLKGVRNGKGTTYYANGKLHYEYTYLNGELDGPLKEYYNSGVLKEELNYKNGKLSGGYKEYHENGKLARESNYVNDILEGPYKTYYYNGQTEKEGNCIKGSMSGKWTYYHSNGKLQSVSTLDEKGKLNGEDIGYDYSGRKFRVSVYQNGDWKKVQYFDASGKIIYETRISNSGTPVVNYSQLLDKAAEGVMKSNERDGIWTFYRPNGDVSSTESQKLGKLNGQSQTFYRSGKVSATYNYTNGLRDGLQVEFHENGKVKSEGYYTDDEKNGVFKSYRADGSLESWEFYLNGTVQEWTTDYFSNGKPIKMHHYTNGYLDKICVFDTAGNVLDTLVLKNGNGPVKLLGMFKKIGFEGNFLNGKNHGLTTWYHPNGKPETQGEYYLGYKHGLWTSYHPNGKVKDKLNYQYGNAQGTSEHYNIFGELVRKFPYEYNMNTGVNVWYYDNGKKESEITYYEEDRHGESRYYAMTGELREVRYYIENKLIGYAYTGKDGKLTDTTFLSHGDGKVKAFYANGNVSTEYEVKAGAYHNSYKIYYPDGKIQEERSYISGEENGITRRFFPDGKVKRSESYVMGFREGQTLEFYANGNARVKENYKNGVLHGLCEYFDVNGKRIHAYVYIDGDVLTVIQ